MQSKNKLPLRMGVGVILLNDKNNVFVKKNKITYYSKQNNDFSTTLCNYHDWGISIFNKKVFKFFIRKIIRIS